MTRTTHHSIQAFQIRHNVFATLAFILALSVGLAGLTQSAQAKGNPRYASIVMDADTGQILSQSNADKKLHPASLTKAMTLLMAFEAIERGEISLRSRMRISRHATTMIPSKLDLPAGSTIKVEDAIYALVTKSANDVAVAMAEKLGGSERKFAQLMTRRAHEIGMDQTTFRNASGLHDPRQISTARDMSKLARVMISRYPKYYAYFSTKNFTYAGKTYRNHNRLMDTYKGMDGMKTGYIQASGFNLVASAVRNNRRIIGVVFGGRTSKSRNRHMAQLLDRGFSKLSSVRVAKARVPLPPRKPGILVALQSLNDMNPTAGGPEGGQGTKWAQLNPALQSNLFSRMIGEGDSDPSVSKRIETGLIAIAAHKGEKIPEKYMQIASLNKDSGVENNIQPTANKAVPYRRPQVNKLPSDEPWAIQVGAFTSRAKTDRMISKSLKSLPRRLATVNPIIAPLNTDTGWLFRGRLSGYTRTQAFEACSYLKDCLPVPPR